MYRTLCVLALLTMQAGLVHCFSWDIVVGAENRIEFYNEGKVTYSVTFTDVLVNWITYDPFHNRVLFTNSSLSLLSFDIATGKRQTLINVNPALKPYWFTYDPATGLFFIEASPCKGYSYLVKPETNLEVAPYFVNYMGGEFGDCGDMAVDSCRGYIYWVIEDKTIYSHRFDGSEREGVLGSNFRIHSLTIDPQTQNMFWTEYNNVSRQYYILSADLKGEHRRTLHHGQGSPIQLTVSNDYIYWTELKKDNKFFWRFPKNLRIGTNVKPKQFAFKDPSIVSGYRRYIIANYAIKEQTQGIPLCKALKRMLPNYSETNDSDSLNVSTGGSLLHVNETKVSEESQVSGDTCDVSVCHNYCFQGNCSVSADGQPKCRCNVGYSGLRCEVNACQTYCLHGGVCSLSEQNNPVCQCTAGYQGEKCDVPDFLIKCSQTVSLLKDILSADLTSVTEGKGVKSTSTSTVV